MKWLLTILLSFLGIFPATAQPRPMAMDSTKPELREIRGAALDTYRQDEDFRYRTVQKELSLWDRFWLWFWRKVNAFFGRKGVQKGTEFFIYGAAILLILFAIYKFAGMDRRKLFRSSGKNSIDFTEAVEDIHAMDLPQAIRQAEEEGSYHLALRLQYLNSLRILSDRQLIRYAINKTNHDYALELAGTPYAKSFARVTLLYEFGWYGEFEVTKDMYEKIREIFRDHVQLLAS